MSNKSHILQKRAASMAAAGESPDAIVAALHIRMSTFMRWQTAPVYQEQLELHRRLLEQRIAMRAAHMLERNTASTLNKNEAAAIAHLAKVIGNERIFLQAATLNSADPAPNSAKKAPLLRQSAPDMRQTAPDMVQITPEQYQLFLRMTHYITTKAKEPRI